MKKEPEEIPLLATLTEKPSPQNISLLVHECEAGVQSGGLGGAEAGGRFDGRPRTGDAAAATTAKRRREHGHGPQLIAELLPRAHRCLNPFGERSLTQQM